MSRLCPSSTQWPLAPNFCSQATRKSQFFHRNHMLGTLDSRGSEPLGSLQFFLEHSLEYTYGKVEPWFTDTHLIWTLIHSGQFCQHLTVQFNSWLMRTLWRVPLVFVLTKVPLYLYVCLVLRKGHLKDCGVLCFHNYRQTCLVSK